MVGQGDTHSRAGIQGVGRAAEQTPPTPPFACCDKKLPPSYIFTEKKRKKNKGGKRKKGKNHSLLITYIITTIGWDAGLLTIDSWAPIASQEEREKMEISLFIYL